MSISATAVRFDEHAMAVELSDGRTLGVPLAWFPRLLHAPPAQRESVELSRTGLHWEDIDEDISVAGLLAGRGDMMRKTERAAYYLHSVEIGHYDVEQDEIEASLTQQL